MPEQRVPKQIVDIPNAHHKHGRSQHIGDARFGTEGTIDTAGIRIRIKMQMAWQTM